MDQVQQKITALPWLQALLIELSTQHFLADDQDCDAELILAEACKTCAESPSYNLDDFEDETDFPLELSKLINERWRGTKRQFCEEALLLENTFYKIQAGKRIPGRDTAICLALALKLSPAEAQHFLEYLGYGLGQHIKRDYIILHCLKNGRKPVEANLALAQSGLRLLGPDL